MIYIFLQNHTVYSFFLESYLFPINKIPENKSNCFPGFSKDSRYLFHSAQLHPNLGSVILLRSTRSAAAFLYILNYQLSQFFYNFGMFGNIHSLFLQDHPSYYTTEPTAMFQSPLYLYPVWGNSIRLNLAITTASTLPPRQLVLSSGPASILFRSHPRCHLPLSAVWYPHSLPVSHYLRNIQLATTIFTKFGLFFMPRSKTMRTS